MTTLKLVHSVGIDIILVLNVSGDSGHKAVDVSRVRNTHMRIYGGRSMTVADVAKYGIPVERFGSACGRVSTALHHREPPQLSTNTRTRLARTTTMSASTASSATNVDSSENAAPKIEALFLIRFDKKVGYVMRQVPCVAA
jgi:hypothetical protein